MAARLIQRFSRLLAASPSFPASSCSIPSECIRACHPNQSTLPRAVPLHTSALCRYTDSRLELKQRVGSQSQENFLALMYSLNTLEEMLQLSLEYQTDGNRAAAIIAQVSKLARTSKADLMNDSRFCELLSAIKRQVPHIRHKWLIYTLRSLYELRVDEKNPCLLAVETEIHHRLRKFNIELLGQLARLVFPYAQTERQKMLLLDLAEHVELRWIEVKDPKTLVNVIFGLSQVSKTLLERMENKVLEFAEFFTPEESRTIIVALAAQRSRSRPILRALSFHLLQRKSELSPSVIIDLMYAYASLSFNQDSVLLAMASKLLPKVPELSNKEITRVIRSFATLKFFNLPLCEAVAQACLQHSSSLTPTELGSVVTSFAHLNFLPSQHEIFFNMVVQRLNMELESLSPCALVDLVWSLCVLQQVTPAFLQKALQPKIYKHFMNQTSNNPSNYILKLIQINATAQLECPEYRGPLLPLSLVSTLLPPASELKLSSLQKDLRNVLQDIFPNKDMCRFNVNTLYGHHIDAEFILDSENNPLALTNFKDLYVLRIMGTNALPEGARRFAVKCWGFSSFCLHTKDLMGWFAMCQRHLQAAGYLVVEVPFYEWQEHKSEWQKSAFLKDRINKIIAEEMSI